MTPRAVNANVCPRAKLLAGRWQCPCHGLHRTSSGRIQQLRPPRERSTNGPLLTLEQRSEIRREAWVRNRDRFESKRRREQDEMAAALVAILERIRAHQLKRYTTTTKGTHYQ